MIYGIIHSQIFKSTARNNFQEKLKVLCIIIYHLQDIIGSKYIFVWYIWITNWKTTNYKYFTIFLNILLSTTYFSGLGLFEIYQSDSYLGEFKSIIIIFFHSILCLNVYKWINYNFNFKDYFLNGQKKKKNYFMYLIEIHLKVSNARDI